MNPVRKWSGRETRALREAMRMSVREFAPHLGVSERTVSKWEAGETCPCPEMQAALDTALRMCDAETVARFTSAAPTMERPDGARGTDNPPGRPLFDDEMEAYELARRIDASDVSAETLNSLDRSFDDLAMAYARTPPTDLLPRVRSHLGYVAQLVDARKTLEQQRRLLTVGGWLSLLAATLHIDLNQRAAAYARLETAARLADHTGDREIAAWCLETQVWDLLTEGRYVDALVLCQEAQRIAPGDGSARVQSIAQEGRAWARLGQPKETRDALNRLAAVVSPMAPPATPEHHYRYDPGKALSYTATTLAWVGDQAAEAYAREVVDQLERAPDGVRRPRRIASAQLDLSLALLAAGKADEARMTALTAICSGRIVPSNRWRAEEIVASVETTGVGGSAELREALSAHCK